MVAVLDSGLAQVHERFPRGYRTSTAKAVRQIGRVLAPESDKKLRGCGWPVGDGGPGLVLVEGGQIRGGQLATCGSLMRCAYCTPYRWSLAEGRGLVVTGRHLDAGGWVGTTALTVPHGASDSLSALYGVLFDGWGARHRWRGLVRARADVGVVGDVAVTHVTYGPKNGWHPHLHVGWFCDGDQDRWSKFEMELASAWRARMLSETGREPSVEHSVNASVVRNPQGFWQYLRPDGPCMHGKQVPDWWNEREAADSDLSIDPGDGWSDRGGDSWEKDVVPDWSAPVSHELLSGIGPGAVAGDRRCQAVFGEYIRASRGRHRIVSWQSLNRAYGVPDVAPSPGRVEAGAGGRVWVHPSVLVRLESQRPVLGRDLVGDGLRSGDPVSAAVDWGMALGTDLEVWKHDVDGAPVIGRPKDLGLHSQVHETRKLGIGL